LFGGVAVSRILSKDEIEDLLRQAKVGRLGLSCQDNPYVIPLCFIYHQGALYFHCSPEGRKMDYLRDNNRACYQVDQVGEMISSEKPCEFNYHFRSVLAEGIICEVTQDGEKFTVLQQLVKKYGGQAVAGRLTAEDVREVEVLKLTIKSLSGCAAG